LNQDAPTGVVAKTRHTFGMLALRAKEVWLLIALSVLVALSEGVGMGLLAPVLQYVQYGEKITKDGGFVWRVLAGVLGAFGLKVDLLSLLLLAFVPIVLRQVVFFLHAWYTAKVQARAATRLRAEGFSALVHGDLAFVVREGHGNLVSGLTAQVTRGGMAIFQFVQQISWGVIIGMYVCLLALLSPGLTAITIVAVGLIAVMIKRNVERSRALGAETTVRNNEAYTVIGERISAIRLIKMLGQEDVETRHITGVVRKLEQVQVRIGISRGIIEVTSDPALMLLVFVVVYCGVAFFHASLATLGLFLFVLLRLNEKVKAFNTGRQVLSANIDSLAHVHDLIARAKESRTVLGGSREFEGLKDRIEFRGVSFCYGDEEGEELVLKDVDLTVPRGAQIALVGRSGAGKSTLVDLLPRLREPSTGDILFDGVPSSEFDLRSLRRSIGFMTQDALLFNDTIRSNLAYGLEREPSDDEIDAALRDAWCADFVAELPSGLETRVGDRGVRLSGGQRQRLALARVFLQDPDILILDEPTSALDSESEEYIQRALATVHGAKTLIVIAHRLSTVQRSDEILVLEKGAIVERGTHAHLLELDGAYRRLFDLQIYQ
jgi:subfamily B ATP-binding cassette protein MsbA